MAWRDRFDELHELATHQTGLTDFGDTDYHKPLRILLDALDSGPPMNKAQEASAIGSISGPLVGRLITQKGWCEHSDVLSAPVERPVIIIGIPRTGTTALYNLLSLDPQFQGIEKWLCYGPMVRPPRETWEAHPQFQAVRAATDQMFETMPDIAVAHGIQPEEPDECLYPMAQSFVSNFFSSNMDSPDYDRWFRTADETGSFRRYADILNLVGKGDARRWLLKNPSHVFGATAMLNAFPDACVIQTHRHPAATIASLTSLLGNIRDFLAGEPIDRARLQAREISFWSEATTRCMATQDAHPDRFVNIMQADIRRDPLGVVRKIYDRFDLTLSGEAERRMNEWARKNPPDGRSGHTYEPVAADAPIQEAFGPYIERYDL